MGVVRERKNTSATTSSSAKKDKKDKSTIREEESVKEQERPKDKNKRGLVLGIGKHENEEGNEISRENNRRTKGGVG